MRPPSNAILYLRASQYNIQLTKDIELGTGSLLQPYVAVENITNYTGFTANRPRKPLW